MALLSFYKQDFESVTAT